MKIPLIYHPSAWFPIALSIAVLAALLGYLAVFGVHHETDEGIAAHLFQIWLAVEIVMISFFALKWLPQKSKQGSVVLVLQIFAVIAACAPVFYFRL